MRIRAEFATTDALPHPVFGNLALAPSGMDTSRVDEGLVRLITGHDETGVAIGLLEKVENIGDKYVMTVFISDEDYAKDYRIMLKEGVRGSFSIGARLRDVVLHYLGDELKDDICVATDWIVVEVSDVVAPADTRLEKFTIIEEVE